MWDKLVSQIKFHLFDFIIGQSSKLKIGKNHCNKISNKNFTKYVTISPLIRTKKSCQTSLNSYSVHKEKNNLKLKASHFFLKNDYTLYYLFNLFQFIKKREEFVFKYISTLKYFFEKFTKVLTNLNFPDLLSNSRPRPSLGWDLDFTLLLLSNNNNNKNTKNTNNNNKTPHLNFLIWY